MFSRCKGELKDSRSSSGSNYLYRSKIVSAADKYPNEPGTKVVLFPWVCLDHLSEDSMMTVKA